MRLENKTTEKAVLGAAFLDNKVLDDMVSLLEPKDFYYMAHQTLYGVLRDMYLEGAAIDYLTVEHKLSLSGQLEEIGGLEYITGLSEDVKSVSAVPGYAKTLKRLSVARTVRESLEQGLVDIDKGSEPEDIVTIVQDVADRGAEALEERDRHLDEDEALKYLEDVQSGERAGQLDIGFPDLQPYAPGVDELMVMAARPSTGKTALALSMADRICAMGGRVLFFSMEMSVRSLQWRRWAAHAGVNLSKLRRRDGLSPEDWTSIAKARETLSTRDLTIFDDAVTLGQVITKTTKAHKKKPLTAIVIDHLLLMQIPDNDRRDLQLGFATGTLKRMCTRLQLPTILLTQINRNSESRDDKKPRLDDLRDSGIIEQDVDVACFLHRPDRNDQSPKEEMQVLFRKNRNGPIGESIVGYRPSTGWFYDYRVPF